MGCTETVKEVDEWYTSFNSCQGATADKSITCTEDSASIAQPAARAAITSWWSPKIANACAAMHEQLLGIHLEVIRLLLCIS